MNQLRQLIYNVDRLSAAGQPTKRHPIKVNVEQSSESSISLSLFWLSLMRFLRARRERLVNQLRQLIYNVDQLSSAGQPTKRRPSKGKRITAGKRDVIFKGGIFPARVQ